MTFEKKMAIGLPVATGVGAGVEVANWTTNQLTVLVTISVVFRSTNRFDELFRRTVVKANSDWLAIPALEPPILERKGTEPEATVIGVVVVTSVGDHFCCPAWTNALGTLTI